MEQLPDDIVLEILVRVTDIPDLLRCAVTSTRWRLLIAHDSFLRRRWPEGARHRSSLLGFFSSQSSPEGRIVVGIPRPLAPVPWSPFRHRRRFPGIPDPPGYPVVPFTSRRGLVLVCRPRLLEGSLDLSVCDPLARKSCRLAPLKANAAVCEGMAHWLYRDRSSHYTLSVSTDEAADISLSKLPIAPDRPGFNFYSAPLLSVTDEGVLSLIRLYRKCTGLEIWTRQTGGNDNGDGMCWHLTNMIRLKRPERCKMDMVQCMCVGEMSNVLLIKDNKNCMYIADMEAGKMENITELFPSVVSEATPFEMDWPAFCMSRLAGGTIKRTT
ncbi:unnamed protein product [Alopecurus aequalis]